MQESAEQDTPKTETSDRKLIRRKIKHREGSGNIVITKSGEDIRSNLQQRLDAMKRDFEKIEFHWNKLVHDPEYFETREYREYSPLIREWELKEEGIQDFQAFKKKMKRLKILFDYFQPNHDYELTVDELVEILS